MRDVLWDMGTEMKNETYADGNLCPRNVTMEMIRLISTSATGTSDTSTELRFYEFTSLYFDSFNSLFFHNYFYTLLVRLAINAVIQFMALFC